MLHVHAPVLWARASALRLPVTPADVPYGTVAMARVVARTVRDRLVADQGVFAMGGHADGIVAWGTSLQGAGGALVDAVARASALTYRDRHAVCTIGPPGGVV